MGELPRSAAGLHQHFNDPNAVDSNGCFVRVAGQVRFAFGKHRGQPLDAVARAKPDYLKWMLDQDFFDDTRPSSAKPWPHAKASDESRSLGYKRQNSQASVAFFWSNDAVRQTGVAPCQGCANTSMAAGSTSRITCTAPGTVRGRSARRHWDFCSIEALPMMATTSAEVIATGCLN